MVRILLFSALLWGYGCGHSPDSETAVDIVGALSQEEQRDCYTVADRPVGIEFPKDSGPHETFKTEWWYYTGNLTHTSGRHFGFQLTFFRQALDCNFPSGRSEWRTNQLYFAHFAITDTQNNIFYAAQRMNRASIGIAGAQRDPFRVWIDNWRAVQAGKRPGHLTLQAKAPLTVVKNQSPTTVRRMSREDG